MKFLNELLVLLLQIFADFSFGQTIFFKHCVVCCAAKETMLKFFRFAESFFVSERLCTTFYALLCMTKKDV